MEKNMLRCIFNCQSHTMFVPCYLLLIFVLKWLVFNLVHFLFLFCLRCSGFLSLLFCRTIYQCLLTLGIFPHLRSVDTNIFFLQFLIFQYIIFLRIFCFPYFFSFFLYTQRLLSLAIVSVPAKLLLLFLLGLCKSQRNNFFFYSHKAKLYSLCVAHFFINSQSRMKSH